MLPENIHEHHIVIYMVHIHLIGIVQKTSLFTTRSCCISKDIDYVALVKGRS